MEQQFYESIKAILLEARNKVYAVVNTANPNPVIGSGVDSGIHKKAGHELLKARQEIGCINFGDAAITPAFGSPVLKKSKKQKWL